MAKVTKRVNQSILLITLFVGFIWIKSSLGKFQTTSFADSFVATIGKFASNNPFPWYQAFLKNVVIANWQLFVSLVMWGELLTACGIFFGSVGLLVDSQSKIIRLILFAGLVGGLFLNIIFWLAAGWMSPSTDSLNLLMAAVEAVGVVYFFKRLRV